MTVVSIRTNIGRQDVDAVWQQGGFAVHLTMGGDEDDYSVTHIASGLCCVQYADKDDAIRTAEALPLLGDWSRGAAEICADNELFAAVRKTMAELGRPLAWSSRSTRLRRLAEWDKAYP